MWSDDDRGKPLGFSSKAKSNVNLVKRPYGDFIVLPDSSKNIISDKLHV